MPSRQAVGYNSAWRNSIQSRARRGVSAAKERTARSAGMTITLTLLTALSYAASWALYIRFLYSNRPVIGRAATALLSIGLITHYFVLLERSRWMHAVPYQDLYGSMSLFGWLLALTYLGLELYHRQRSVGAFVLPFVLIYFLAAHLTHPHAPVPPPARGSAFAFHVTLSILAYSAFALSFVLSLMFLAEQRLLRSHKMGTVVWRFPPLELLERMSRSSVLIGLVSIVIGTLLGYVWVERLNGGVSQFDPKYIVTLLVMGLYAVYLLVARSAGWRGARASKLCIFNFVLVVLSFTVVNVYLSHSHRYF